MLAEGENFSHRYLELIYRFEGSSLFFFRFWLPLLVAASFSASGCRLQTPELSPIQFTTQRAHY
jgi:hypothetical protein